MKILDDALYHAQAHCETAGIYQRNPINGKHAQKVCGCCTDKYIGCYKKEGPTMIWR